MPLALASGAIFDVCVIASQHALIIQLGHQQGTTLTVYAELQFFPASSSPPPLPTDPHHIVTRFLHKGLLYRCPYVLFHSLTCLYIYLLPCLCWHTHVCASLTQMEPTIDWSRIDLSRVKKVSAGGVAQYWWSLRLWLVLCLGSAAIMVRGNDWGGGQACEERAQAHARFIIA